MATLIDFYNNTVEDLKPIIESIQKRYLDPYTIRLTTDTNNYRFVEGEVNKAITALYGDNTVVKGLDIYAVSVQSDYTDVYVHKGTLIADNTVIEFTDDMQIRVPNDWLDNTNTEYNVLAIDYVHTQSYPPRIAIPYVKKESAFSDEIIKVATSAFKLNGTTVTELSPNKKSTVNVTIKDTAYKITPSYGSIKDIKDYIANLGVQNNIPTKAEFEARAEQIRRLTAGSGFVEWGKFDSNAGTNNKINSGMYTVPIDWNIADSLVLGAPSSNTAVGNSRTLYPIVNVNGYLIRLSGTNYVNVKNVIKFPDPPSTPDQLYRQDLVFLELQ